MEYLLLIIEFFWVKGFRSVVITCVVPLIIGLLIFYVANDCIYINNASSFHSNLVTVLGILIGFTISTLTMLLTVNNTNIEKAKNRFLNRKIFSKQFSLFDSVVTGLAYNILIQGFLLIANFIYPIFISISTIEAKAFFSINIAIMVHVILILMRNVLDFYFILTKKS